MDNDFLFLAITLPQNNDIQERFLLEQEVDNPLFFLVLRKPDWTKLEIKVYLESLEQRFLKKIILYNEGELLEHFPCRGVHFPAYAMEQVRPIRSSFAHIWLSTSVHNKEELGKANELPLSAILVSPVFSTVSKVSHLSPLGVKGLLRLKNISLHPVIALGGITNNNFMQCLNTGVRGIAAIGAFWLTENQPSFLREKYHESTS